MTAALLDIEQHVSLGVELQRSGDIDRAIEHFLEVLKVQPSHPVALYSLAAICLNQGKHKQGLAYARQCLASASASPLAWYIHGVAMKALRCFDEALRNLNHALSLDPRYIEPLLEKANIYLEAQDYPQAIHQFDQILTIDPSHALAAGNRARLLSLPPRAPDMLSDRTLRGLALQNEGSIDAAQAVFRQILQEDVNHFVALYSLAAMSVNQGKTADGLHYGERCLKSDPKSPFGWYIYGCALKAARRFPEAQEQLDRALLIDPTHKESHFEKGISFGETKDYVNALIEFNHVLHLDPEHKLALVNLATSLTILKRNDEASQFFERLLQIDPEHDYALGALVHARLHCCNWTDFEVNSERISQAVREGKRSCKPLAFLALSDSPSDQLRCSRTFSEQAYPISSEQLWSGERYSHHKPRIGYVSPDFREHPVGHLMAGVFEHHDRAQFDIYSFSLGVNDNSTLRERFIAASDHFLDVRGRTSREIAQLIRTLEIDLLIDLAGPTMDAQPDIFAFRPAPIQAGYLGYPGTSGASYYDYIIADATVIPEADSRYYTEQVIRLPDCYLPTDSRLKPAKRTAAREELQLPPDGFVYCSFNHDYKINPPIFGVWMRILTRVPGSVLWLMKLNDSAEQNIRKEAALRGIDPSRLIFANRVPSIEEHLARYRLADLFLDTFPYNAHSTATDALRAGLPVITVIGRSFQSRVATSVLKALDMSQLAFATVQEYEDFAVEMASDSAKFGDLKQRLDTSIRTTTLFDTQLFTRRLEQAFTSMLAKRPPLHC